MNINFKNIILFIFIFIKNKYQIYSNDFDFHYEAFDPNDEQRIPFNEIKNVLIPIIKIIDEIKSKKQQQSISFSEDQDTILFNLFFDIYKIFNRISKEQIISLYSTKNMIHYNANSSIKIINYSQFFDQIIFEIHAIIAANINSQKQFSHKDLEVLNEISKQLHNISSQYNYVEYDPNCTIEEIAAPLIFIENTTKNIFLTLFNGSQQSISFSDEEDTMLFNLFFNINEIFYGINKGAMIEPFLQEGWITYNNDSINSIKIINYPSFFRRIIYDIDFAINKNANLQIQCTRKDLDVFNLVAGKLHNFSLKYIPNNQDLQQHNPHSNFSHTSLQHKQQNIQSFWLKTGIIILIVTIIIGSIATICYFMSSDKKISFDKDIKQKKQVDFD